MTRNDIEAILLDLGGVLIELGGISTMMQWTGWGREEFWRRWLTSPSVRRFESGKLAAQDFGDLLVDEFKLPVRSDKFLATFTRWPKGIYPGTIELLDQMGKKFRLGCLSNTNALHWRYLSEETDLFKHLHYLLPSHITGLLKPDRAAFENAARKMGLESDKILFLDDNHINVRGACETGMQSFVVHGIKDMKKLLRELDLLEGSETV